MSAVAIPESIWREYDVRGVAGRDLTPELAYLLGYAFAELAARRGGREVLVGRDNRTSSPELAAGVMAGIRAAGLAVIDLGQVTTPVFYFARVHYGISPGVMVTASHNPGQENGFKLALGPGTLVGQEIADLGARVRELAAQGLPGGPPGAGAAAGPLPPVEQRDPLPAYFDDMVRRVVLPPLPRPLHVVVDCGNGTASPITPEVYRRLGCRVTELYCVSDPTFPHHHPDPVRPENLRDLIAEVRRLGADVGIGIDGDGDRLGAVADDGRILWGDELMMLFWRELLPRYPGSPVLVEVKCSQALWDDTAARGGRPFFHRTGHSHIKATLYARNLPFAGELSGHLFFHDEFPGYDDATYAGARLLRLVAQAGRPLSALAAELPRYYSTPEVRVPCADDVKFDVVERLTRHFARTHDVVTVDGARVLFADGWGLVRASNTQPVLVLRCEGKTPQALQRICAEMAAALQHHPEVGPVVWN
jgi:phosphomannomutase/phosphoglucomutase